MSLLRRATRAAGPVQEFGDSSIPTNGSLAHLTASGVPVNDQTAMKLISLFACVRILANTVAGLPIRAMQAAGSIQVPVDRQPTIVVDPFGGGSNTAWPTRRDGAKQLVVSAALRGNGYAVITARDYLFRPARLSVCHPDSVKVDTDDSGGRIYEVNRVPVDTVDMVHVMGMSMPGAITGMSPIAYARTAIGLGLAAEEFAARFFGDGAHLSGVIEVKEDMTVAQARQMKEAWDASHAGLKNSHASGILSGGASWKSITVPPEDAQFLGTKAASNLDMAMLYGIPPHMLGQVDRTTSWGTGIEQQALGFLAYTMGDWLGMFEDAWTGMLPRGQSACFDTRKLQRTDRAGRMAAAVAARTANIETINELRGEENLPPVEGGDDIHAPLNSAHTNTGAAPGDTEPEGPAHV
ncbi:putative phage portal protein [Actinacidiphila reveromycinica]|uniref:Putative phage portal protein n=1 Tax=Actinacidiphila reveromycinica TaxID=659352 RepID=A0A7U3VRD3_9ACTN|nr:phage portal protein [Streptomyces sp. SN-593]BBB00580.1 putative phage portal protein [Streptomyces sp. SN-593]BBB00633.1 putative phage portal protein [Streptomyces sp. SN-593]